MSRPVLDPAARRVFDTVLLVLSLIVVGMSVLLAPGPELVSIFGWEIPVTCTFRLLTGHECPGCGLTRSFVYMGHGDVVTAFRMHWVGPILYTLVAAQIPWRIVRLVRSRGIGPAIPLS